jgi:hypothetical protein
LGACFLSGGFPFAIRFWCDLIGPSNPVKMLKNIYKYRKYINSNESTDAVPIKKKLYKEAGVDIPPEGPRDWILKEAFIHPSLMDGEVFFILVIFLFV